MDLVCKISVCLNSFGVDTKACILWGEVLRTTVRPARPPHPLIFVPLSMQMLLHESSLGIGGSFGAAGTWLPLPPSKPRDWCGVLGTGQPTCLTGEAWTIKALSAHRSGQLDSVCSLPRPLTDACCGLRGLQLCTCRVACIVCALVH